MYIYFNSKFNFYTTRNNRKDSLSSVYYVKYVLTHASYFYDISAKFIQRFASIHNHIRNLNNNIFDWSIRFGMFFKILGGFTVLRLSFFPEILQEEERRAGEGA